MTSGSGLQDSDSTVLRAAQATLPVSAHLNPNAKGETGSGSWTTWSRTLLGVLDDHLAEIILGDRPKPLPTHPTYAAWQRDNAIVRRAILHSTVDAIHVVDASVRDSKEIYDTLQNHYSPNDTETNFRMLRDFF